MEIDKPTADILTHEAEAITRRIHPLLFGHNEFVQGAVLADLMATYLAGHIAIHHGSMILNRNATDQLRVRILREWIKTVRKLLPINELPILDRLPKAN